MLLTALAEKAEVTLLTVGEAADFAGVDVVALAPDTRPHGVDRARAVLRGAVRGAGPEDLGLPPDPRYFDAVVGSGWTSGREAHLVRAAFYPGAITADALHMDPHGLGAALGDPERGRLVAGIHRDLFGRSDLVFAPGPKAARDVRALLGGTPPGSSPSVHEMVPGVTVTTRAPARSGDLFELLMLGRVEDRNKGALDVARAVAALLRRGHRGLRLTLRGVPPARVAPFRARMDAETGMPGVVRVLPFTADRVRIEADIDACDALVVASESEAYGLVGGECAARGTPLLVARGNGNGFAELLTGPEGLAGGRGRRFVVEDGGSVSSLGARMGRGSPHEGPRHLVLARAIARLARRHDRALEHAAAVRRALGDYTPGHMAAAFAEAVRRTSAGVRGPTRQGPGGQLLGPDGRPGEGAYGHGARPGAVP